MNRDIGIGLATDWRIADRATPYVIPIAFWGAIRADFPVIQTALERALIDHWIMAHRVKGAGPADYHSKKQDSYQYSAGAMSIRHWVDRCRWGDQRSRQYAV